MTAVVFLFFSTAPRICRANGGPGPWEFALIAEIPVVLGEVGADLEIPFSRRHALQLWAGVGGCLAIVMEELTPIAPDFSLELRTYFRKDQFRGGFVSLYLPAGYLYQHDLVVYSPGVKFGYKAVTGCRFSLEVYASVNVTFYAETEAIGHPEYGFYPLHTTGLRFTFQTYVPGSPGPPNST